MLHVLSSATRVIIRAGTAASATVDHLVAGQTSRQIGLPLPDRLQGWFRLGGGRRRRCRRLLPCDNVADDAPDLQRLRRAGGALARRLILTNRELVHYMASGDVTSHRDGKNCSGYRACEEFERSDG